MPSSFTSRLKLERQASGENSGTWGNLVNYVLNRVDASVKGYQSVDVAGSANVTLTSNNSTSNTDDSATDDQVHNAILEFTGLLTANINVFTDAVETNYAVFNNTTGSFTLTFGPTGGAGVDIKQGTKTLVYTDGTTMYDITKDLGDIQVTGLTSNGAVSITGDTDITGNTDVTGNIALKTQGAVVFEDSSGGEFAAIKANATTTSYTLTLPPTTGTADQVMATDGSGNLSFTDVSGGTSWQSSIVTANANVTAGNGYWINTTSGAVTLTLPGSASVGDTIEFVDYARTWEANAVTFDLNGLLYQGDNANNPRYNTDGQAVRIVYSGATQGWIPTSDDDVTQETEELSPYLVIAGGGGGGVGDGGGGGAGGYRNSFTDDPFSGRNSSIEDGINLVSGTTYTISVGGGGSGASYPGKSPGVSGTDSSISAPGLTTITSIGGGNGGSGDGGVAGDGGSGGGGGTASGSGTAGQGFDGAPGGSRSGGGGAGQQGGTPGNSDGGDGLSSSIDGSATFRAGGGGGSPSSTGGTGGGGAPVAPGTASATAGTANTGSGGGGTDGGSSAAGGSGIVFLRVKTTDYSGTTTGSPTVTTDGTYTVLKYTGSGSYTH
jgi:hypothetical protein